MNFFRKELLYTLILLLGSMSHGLTMAFWSTAKVSMSAEFGLKNSLQTFFNFLAPFACIFGGPLISFVLERFGRKKAAFLTAVLMCVSWEIMGFVKHSFYALAFVTRFLTGFCVGSFSTIIPMYITELAPTEVRGAYGTLHQMGIGTGASICYLMGYWLSDKWATVCYISGAPCGLLSFLIWIIPESPAMFRKQESHFKESLFQRKFLRPALISGFLMFFQQFAGTSAFLANLQPIFQDCHINLNDSIASFLVGITGVIAVVITSGIIGFFGRRPAWHISSAAQAVALALAACNEKWQFSKILPVVCLIADNFFFSIGLAPIPWFIVPELFPDTVRSFATSFMVAINWIFGSALFYVWDYMDAGLGKAWSFGFFGIIMVGSLIFGILYLPEPKGDMGQQDSIEPFSKENYQQVLD